MKIIHIRSIILLAALSMTAAVGHAKDIFDSIAGNPQVESTYISGRVNSKSVWQAQDGEATIKLAGFDNMYTYLITDESVAKKAKRLLDKYLKANPDVDLVLQKTSDMGKRRYEYYYKYGPGDRVYQAICWYATAPNNVEIAVVNWKNGYGYNNFNQLYFSTDDGTVVTHVDPDFAVEEAKKLHKELEAQARDHQKAAREIEKWTRELRNATSKSQKSGRERNKSKQKQENAKQNGKWKPASRTMSLDNNIKRLVNYDNFDILFQQGSPSISISGPDNVIKGILVSQEDGAVMFKADENAPRDYSDCSIIVSSPDISTFITYGSGDMVIGPWIGEGFNYQNYGSGDMGAQSISGRNIVLRSYGSGDIGIGTIKGTSLEMYLAGSGDMSVGEIYAKNSDLMLLGTGDMNCTYNDATAEIYATNSASGDMMLTGRCRTATTTNIGSGEMRISGLKGDKILNRDKSQE